MSQNTVTDVETRPPKALRIIPAPFSHSLNVTCSKRDAQAGPPPSHPPSQESRGSLSYSNSIRGRPWGAPGHLTVRHRVPQLKFTCSVDSPSAAEFVPGAEELRQGAAYGVSVAFLQLPVAPPVGNARPEDAGQREEVFLQATLHSPDPGLRVSVDTCVASPDPHDFATVKYDLIRQG